MGKLLINAKEVSEIMECSEGHAYGVIRQLNQELQAKGFIVRAGRVPRKYFFERVGIEEADA